ncbi:alpha/beta fold hydrolase [Nocardioides gilvus]|uniref:alpha/beta fold hydrolase n=1 Tax=Nocardioides gilvus TaxID=1735589 RepID=UPI000D74F3DD|nr:alpha/beta fold hydrolase [Nocardioides gilvus]
MSVAQTIAADFAALAAPDHADSSAWVLRGEHHSFSGVPSKGDDEVLVFYVHPTTGNGPGWFADPQEHETLAAVDQVTGEHLEAFPGRVWAPRYRQTTTRAYFERGRGGEQAYQLAYSDVAAAFAQFLADDAVHALEHPGEPRPIVLAGHSQGARHVMQLLEDFFDHDGLASRLVASYPIGIGVAEDASVLARFPAASDPDSSGVVVCFRATLEWGAEPETPGVCLNPLTCSTQVRDAPASWHLPVETGTSGPLAGIRVAARVRGDFVLVDPIRPGALDKVALPGGGLHRVELQLFARNLRNDVRRRVAAWRARHDDECARLRAADPGGSAPDAHAEVPYWPGVLGERIQMTAGQIHYVDLPATGADAGSAAELPVVLLHKLGGWAADWRGVAQSLSGVRRVVVVDLPGHGGSRMDVEAPWVMWPQASAQRLWALLDELGIERAHLMGSSLGGIVSLLMTVSAPERVVSLGLVGVSLTPAHTAARVWATDQAVRANFGPGWVPVPGVHARAGTSDPVVLAEQDASRARAGQWVRPSERGVGLSGVAHLLGEVDVPVLVVNGENAGYRVYEQSARDLLRDVEIETVAGAGSFPHQERPEAVAALWESFVHRR